MVLRMCQSDEDGTQHGEHVSLDECHQELQTVHEEYHDKAEQRQTRAEERVERPSDEDDGGERQDDGMSCHHVGKETDHQRKGLGQNTKQFDEGHDGHGVCLQESRHVGPEDFLPVLLVAEEVDGQHGAQRQEERDVDVTRHVGSTREYRQQS